ncbi:isatin hydrolase-like [Penaeus japonicus]|uniref:isatin hydrolase-like n=1 Tax=Penaeus japonicus TaxID=27405 RepID=UPI001C70D95B|nr:isatin hydrolase-like [Penaeus japonicus]XP_042886134.1 isatin hydrolase-like [Penaeus japonicus]
MARSVGSLAGLVSLLAIAMADVRSSDLLELSYTYNVDAPTSPKLTPFTFKVIKKGYNDFGAWVELNEFCSSEHSGTHLDAPVHFAKDRWSVADIPLDRLWRVPAVVIDVSEAIERSGLIDYPIKAEDLEAFEKVHGVIPDHTVVLVRTGWGLKSGDLQEYSNVDETNTNHFPGLSEEAATWLATHGERHGHTTGIVGVGVDTISVDVGNSTRYSAHVAMYSRNIFGLENVANMHKLPASGFHLTILPMRIGGGSGAPARIIAEFDQRADALSSASSRNMGVSLVTLLPVFLPVLIAMVLGKQGS